MCPGIPGIDIRPRGATNENLVAMIRAMTEPADLIVLDGQSGTQTAVYLPMSRLTESRNDGGSALYT